MLETDRRTVPFLDLAASNAPLKSELLAEISALVDSSAFTNGPHVRAFEEAFASYCGTTSCVGVSSGLDALRLTLLAAGVGQGDEVIVPAMTFVATFEAVAQSGATPVPVDVGDDDYGLDVSLVPQACGRATRAVMPVHLYGQLSDLASLARVTAGRRLAIVEDACQAHGGARGTTTPGSNSLAAAFSFYPAKNLGAMGDGGAVVTNDLELAERVRALREHGQVAKYRHEHGGYTARLDTMQALVLERKLPHLDEWNAERRAIADQYLAGLAGVGDLRLPSVVEDSVHAWHLFVVRTADPDALAAFLSKRGIATGRHYPEPPHLSPAWRHLGHEAGAFPVAEGLARECLSLPIYPGLLEEQVDVVVRAVRARFDG